MSRKISWNDDNDLEVIQKSLNVDSADVQSLTDSIDAWVDDFGALKKGNYIIGLNINGNNYQLVGKILLLGLDNKTGKTRGLSEKEMAWISQNIHIWQKPIGFIN
ncbi:hypothetical protein RV11_GL002280 [Enterococcus phoeniculicola]|nr:hypothetical protein RV11_GL002280 [Enterococcus phoeniculicola]